MMEMTVTVNSAPLLGTPPTVTITLPVVAPVGTETMMLVLLQLVGVAVVPLKRTVLVPCVAPKFAPVIVTAVPTGPEVGDRLVMLGAVLPLAALHAAVVAHHSLEADRFQVADAG